MRNTNDTRFFITISLLACAVIALIILILFPVHPIPSQTTEPTVPTSSDTYLTDEETVTVEEPGADGKGEQQVVLPVQKVLFEYVEVIDGCGPHFEGACLHARSGPGTDFSVVANLRNGMVLKVGGKVERASATWYKIVFDEWLRYPERLSSDWYIAADFVQVLTDEGDRTIWDHAYSTTTGKKIVVKRGEQKLYVYNNDVLFKEISISTGLELTPTPRGTFTIFKKTPSRYMQGPLPNLIDQQVYDLPGVPWNLYFTQEGAVIHGAYWHTSFGSQYSHGCVNLWPSDARTLYMWAELGTKVIVED
jgi:hypothetical protein